MQYYHYSPSQAGITVTIFLLGVVLSSAFFAPRFNRLPRRLAATGGFAVATAAFCAASLQAVDVASFQPLALLHGLAGLGVGCALSFTHGCIGRTSNPHQLFAIVNVVLGVFAVVFLAGVPQLLQHFSAAALFVVIAASMGIATVAMALFFPDLAQAQEGAGSMPTVAAVRMPRAVWFVIGVVMCLTLNQAMVFSFMERMGTERGFGADRVNSVLVALGLVNLMAGLLAALLQKKWSPVAVGMVGPIGQAVLALVMSSAVTYAPYAVAASVYVSMVIFTHTFLFGLLSRLDPSGRAVAATPAMMMVGSCIGPALGGAIVQGLGYPGLGWMACAVACIAAIAMLQVQRRLPPVPVGKPLHA